MTRPSPIARSSAAEALKRVAFVVAVFALPAFAQEDGGGAMGIETFEEVDAGTAAVAPLETFKSEPAAPTVRIYGWTSAYTSLDTRFDSPRGAALAENVWEGRLRAVLGVDVKLNEHVRLVLEGRAQVRGATQRDFDRAKGFFEPMLGDAFVDLYTSKDRKSTRLNSSHSSPSRMPSSA